MYEFERFSLYRGVMIVSVSTCGADVASIFVSEDRMSSRVGFIEFYALSSSAVVV